MNEDSTETAGGGHVVQFYERDEYLLDEVATFLERASRDGSAIVVIAGAEHRHVLEARLGHAGVNVAGGRAAGWYVALDAEETLEQISIDGEPDAERFREVIGGVLRAAAGNAAAFHVRVFGEVVALLQERGQLDAAIRLERLWNELGQDLVFSLFCAYPMSAFAHGNDARPLTEICESHTHVLPPESYARASPGERFRAAAVLQENALALESESQERRQVEAELERRLEHEAKSEGLGRGAEFVIRLPSVAAAPDEAAQRPKLGISRSSGARVLVIEDNADGAESIRMLLSLLGYHVRVAADGDEGLRAACANPPDVMLVDIGLPGIDGYEVARRVRHDPALAHLPLIAITGYGREEDRQHAMAAGFDYHLVKPVELSQLQELVERMQVSTTASATTR